MTNNINESELIIFLTDIWLSTPSNKEETFLCDLKRIGFNKLISELIHGSFSDEPNTINHYTKLLLEDESI